MHTWKNISYTARSPREDGVPSERVLIDSLKVESGYIYRIKQYRSTIDLGGNQREDLINEQFIHGSMDHSDGKTENDSERSVEEEANNSKVSRIRRSAKRRG